MEYHIDEHILSGGRHCRSWIYEVEEKINNQLQAEMGGNLIAPQYKKIVGESRVVIRHIISPI